MGKGSTRRPEDRKAIEANWPFRDVMQSLDEALEHAKTHSRIASTNEEQPSKLPKE
jgi:hypothetical protein